MQLLLPTALARVVVPSLHRFFGTNFSPNFLQFSFLFNFLQPPLLPPFGMLFSYYNLSIGCLPPSGQGGQAPPCPGDFTLLGGRHSESYFFLYFLSYYSGFMDIFRGNFLELLFGSISSR